MEKSCLLSQHRFFIVKYGFCHFFSVVLVFGKQSKCWSCNMRPERCWKVVWTWGASARLLLIKDSVSHSPEDGEFQTFALLLFLQANSETIFFSVYKSVFLQSLIPHLWYKNLFLPFLCSKFDQVLKNVSQKLLYCKNERFPWRRKEVCCCCCFVLFLFMF